jgi:hypothetical protein
MSYDMVPEDTDLVSEIVEASFFLDLFDAAMDICFHHVLGEPMLQSNEVFRPDASLLHFIEQSKSTFDERGVTMKLSISSPATIMGSANELRTLTNSVIYELLSQAKSVVKLDLRGSELTITADGTIDMPPLFGILKRVFHERGVEFDYDDTRCVLRYSA